MISNENEHARAQIADAKAELARAGEGARGLEREAAAHRTAIADLRARMETIAADIADLRAQMNALE